MPWQGRGIAAVTRCFTPSQPLRLYQGEEGRGEEGVGAGGERRGGGGWRGEERRRGMDWRGEGEGVEENSNLKTLFIL